MNGTLTNYLLHALGGLAIWAAVSLIAWVLGGNAWHGWVAATAWYYSHEVTDLEWKLPGSAKANLWDALQIWRERDGLLDFLAPFAAVTLATIIMELI